MGKQVSTLVPWWQSRGEVLGHVLNLVASGVLSIDVEGRVWRHCILTKHGRKAVPAKRAESRTKKGYLAVVFRVPGQRLTRHVLAHVLVWTHANGEIPTGLQVNHKDLNKANNNLGNLELVTPSGNIRHSYANGRTRPYANATEWRPGKAKLTAEDRQQVFMLRRGGKTYDQIVSLTGISKTHVARILKGGSR